MTAMNSAKSGRSRLSERHRAQRNELIRKEIVDAAIVEFTERGYHDASIANIAERLGSGPSTIYHYFTSKREILEQAVDDTIASIATLLAGMAADAPSTADAFSAAANRFGDALADLFVSDPRVPRMMLVISSSTDPELRARWTSMFEVFKTLVDQFLIGGVQAGFLRAGMNTTATAAAILAIPMGLIASDPTGDPDRDKTYALVSATVAMVTYGIRSTSPADL